MLPIDWFRKTLTLYEHEPFAIYRPQGTHGWPLTAHGPEDLTERLERGGHLVPLPQEPAALANIIEVSIVNFLLERLEGLKGAIATRGTERGYPDLEVSGDFFGGGFTALDVKVARRGRSGNRTESPITLYTGNSYFRYPKLQWPHNFRPFAEYESHLVLLAIYTLNRESVSRIEDLELIVQESWRVGSRSRSSSTREYIGAVSSIQRLRDGDGEFQSSDEFYSYWRNFNFRITKQVQRQLDKLIEQQGSDQN